MRLLSALIAEAGSLAVLWYVLSSQRRNWKDIGWKLRWTDMPLAVGLYLATSLASILIYLPIQISYQEYSGHYLTPKTLHGMLGGGISVLSITFVLLNPFFEELIVRGYFMSEVLELGGGGALAVLASVLVQMSYHLYQGFANCIALTVTFTIFAIYFLRTRRIAPLVMVHFIIDAYALIRYSI